MEEPMTYEQATEILSNMSIDNLRWTIRFYSSKLDHYAPDLPLRMKAETATIIRAAQDMLITREGDEEGGR